MNYFDLHCDTAFELYKRNLPFNNNELSVTAGGEKLFDKWVQTFAVWVADDADNPFTLYKSVLKDIKNKLTTAPHNLTPIFSVEGGAVIGEDISRVGILKQDGIKMLTLTWNGKNAIGGGSKTEKGLTDFGKKVIYKLNDLKIACDLSHLNSKSFYRAVEHAKYPIATHSNCYEICPHTRNLTLEQIKLIAKNQGIIGLTFYPHFLGENVLEKLYQNIYFLCDKGLESHIALGSDFDGGEMNNSLDNIFKIPTLYTYLEGKGLKTSLLDKIFYQNAYNFIAKLY